MLFCPNCANTLLVESSNKGLRFFCQTCAYIHNVEHTYRKVVPLKRKALGSVMGSEEAWKSAEQIDEPCPVCGNGKAYFQMIQTRSADEPSSIFYRCQNSKCKHQWQEK